VAIMVGFPAGCFEGGGRNAQAHSSERKNIPAICWQIFRSTCYFRIMLLNLVIMLSLIQGALPPGQVVYARPFSNTS
jgi:hypothetical protein